MGEIRLDAFLLTRQWRDAPQGLEYEFWASSPRGPVRILMTNQEAVSFVDRQANTSQGRRANVNLKSLNGAPVDALYFPTQHALNRYRREPQAQGISLFESDIKPVDRFLMERFITGPMTVLGHATQKANHIEFTNPRLYANEYSPDFSIASLDIETEGLTGQLYSVAVVTNTSEKVFMVGNGDDDDVLTFCGDERSLLEAFFSHIQAVDPDIIIGWNVVEFDLHFLERLCDKQGMAFLIGRNGEPARVLAPRTSRQAMLAQVPGRVTLDGIATLKTAMYHLENYSLEAVAQSLLGKGKLISHDNRVEEITRLFQQDPTQLAAYNLEDCRLCLEIFDCADLINLVVERARLTGLPLDRQGGSVAAFDFTYLPRLHRQGYVAPDLRENPEPMPSPGGYVMDSQPGLHKNVIVLDFKSLYPSIIRTFHVDPLAMAVPGSDPIPGFSGAGFSRETSILPEITESLWEERDRAKKVGNKPLSQAIKILMNSFYGVLGTPGCRFSSPKLAGSITRYGKEIITKSREFIEGQGYEVLYGDTDSAHVLLGTDHDEQSAAAIGDELAVNLNEWWRDHLRTTLDIESYLDIEFETHYLRYLMPTIRGSDKGSKKRYAGLVRQVDGQLSVTFTGLECVRSDWTPLARKFQRTLFEKVFLDEPYEDYVRQVVRDLFRHKLDDELVYRKQLRKPVGEYVKNIPPHAQAAKQLDKPGRWISYVVTVNGPQPMEKQTSPPDYSHYLERQLAPVADSILHFLDTSLAELVSPQMQLF